MTYLDNAATTRPDPAVIEAMRSALGESWGNPSSVHESGKAAKRVIENARTSIAQVAGCYSDEVFFTSGGTEADNWAVEGALSASAKAQKHLVVSAIEHHAVLDAAKAATEHGVELTIVPVSKDGYVNPEEVRNAIRPETVLVSVMHVNNELGTIQPVEEIAHVCRERDVLFHSDFVQSFGKISSSFVNSNIDIISMSAHKIHGPKGIGALIVRRGTRVARRQHGGSQERGKRTGTENVPGIAGFGAAADLCAKRMQEDSLRIRELRDTCERELLRSIPDLIVNGRNGARADGILSVMVPRCDGEELLVALDMRGICVSTGAACSAGATGASHVMTALGLESEAARSSLRISFGRFSSSDDVSHIVSVLPKIVETQRSTSPAATC
ncbi:MAG: cysteine desulfurase [Calditrichaeota bacterium]|nr:cysteine desulfurase [Calditrichota bacterium]